jgi:predicted metal-binding membrane protein
MYSATKTSRRIQFVLLIISAVAWIMIFVNPDHQMGLQHHMVADSGLSDASGRMAAGMNLTTASIVHWGTMVVAMMFPLLIPSVRYIYRCSLKRRRFRSSALFVVAYTATWMVASTILLPMIATARLLLPTPYVLTIYFGVVVLTWQFSPLKQKFLNRSHGHPNLAAFGHAADRNALLFGVTHAWLCIASGWLLMILPMVLPAGHKGGMVLVTLIMIAEHLERPRAPHWRLFSRVKFIRILSAQSQMRLKQLGLPIMTSSEK